VLGGVTVADSFKVHSSAAVVPENVSNRRQAVWQALALLALVAGLVLLTVLMRRRRGHLIDKAVNQRLNGGQS